jgi:RNA polymerase sigma-70 factor (ECF subfamily)
MSDHHVSAFLEASQNVIPTLLDAGRIAGLVQHAWPMAKFDGAAFGAFLATRTVEGQGIAELHVDDLYLAWACLSGQRDAIAAFERYTRPLIALAVRRDSRDADELIHTVQIKLLVPEGSRASRLSDYTGVGPLKAFVMVMAMRCLADARRGDQRRKEDAVGDGWLELASIAGSTTNPEERTQWSELEPHAAAAVRDAMGALSARQRNLLRLHYVEGVSAEALGRMYRVHRATTTRWLVDTRAQLLELVQQRLRGSLELSTASMQGLNQTLVGGLELSLPSLLGSEGGTEEP